MASPLAVAGAVAMSTWQRTWSLRLEVVRQSDPAPGHVARLLCRWVVGGQGTLRCLIPTRRRLPTQPELDRDRHGRADDRSDQIDPHGIELPRQDRVPGSVS